MRSEGSVTIMLIDACLMTWEIVLLLKQCAKDGKPVYTIQQRLPCMTYISTENIDMKFTQILWLIALQPQGWLICILCNVIKNKILYVFRALIFTRHFQQLFEVSMAEIVTPVWQMGLERGSERLTHSCPSYLLGITSSMPLEYPYLWMLKSFIWNCRVFVNNLCISFCIQWNSQWHGFELCGSAYTQIFSSSIY